MATRATATLSAQNTFTDLITVRGAKQVDFSLSGVNGHTVTVQRRRAGSSTWLDVEDFTTNTEQVFKNSGGVWEMRAGVKTGNFGTGNVTLDISAGNVG